MRVSREVTSRIYIPIRMVDLSIVIAVYNEERRLQNTLEKVYGYMKTRGESFEIIIVNDGSTDKTTEIVEKFCLTHAEVILLSHMPNRGRGYSIREGVLKAKGNFILETDADNSVDNEAIGRFLDFLYAHPDTSVLFGSREMKHSIIKEHQPFLRLFLGKAFIVLAHLFLGLWNIHDFTLGFKMFRRDAARDIFSHQYDNYYFAEAEIVCVSQYRKWKYFELPITWINDRDSKVNPYKESFRAFLGVIRSIGNHIRGRYN